MQVHAASPTAINALGDDIVTSTTRSLGLLKDIEQTISSLCYDQKMYAAFADFALGMAEQISKAVGGKPLDPDGVLEEKLSRAQNFAHELHVKLRQRRASAISDPQLTDEDGVAEEFARTIVVVSRMHDALDAVRFAVGEHDADLETPTGPAFSDKEKLSDYLKSI